MSDSGLTMSDSSLTMCICLCFCFWSCVVLRLCVINLKPALIFFQLFIEMAKQFYACNWVPSRVTEEQLEGCVATGTLAKKEVIHWRVPGPENPPKPKDGEVVVFVDYLGRGFSPPGNSSEMYLLASNSILRTLDQTLCPMFAISKYFARLICKKNPPLNYSETSSI